MRKVLVVLLVLIVAAGAFLYFPRGGVDAVNAAVLSVMNAAMDAQKTGQQDYVAAIDGEIFNTGDLVRSKDVGHGVLTFFDGSTVSIDPSTQVRVAALSREGADGLQLTLEQTTGRIYSSVTQLKTPNSRFEIKTPTLTATVRGTLFESIISLLGTTLRVHEGQVLARDLAGKELLLGPGDEVTVGVAGLPAAVTKTGPLPTLRFSGPAGMQFVVIDPRGYRCGRLGTSTYRQLPCSSAGQSVSLLNVVGGTYTVMANSTQAITTGELVAEGLRGGTTDFTQRLARAYQAGDIVKTTIAVQVAQDGKMTAGPFSAPEVVTNICGAEATGRVFSTGKLEQREASFRQFALANKGQPSAIVVTTSELADAANGVLQGENIPVTVTDVSIHVDPAGLHLNATFGFGPLSIPGKADVIAGAVNGKLVMKVRGLSAPPVPQSVMDQIAGQLEGQLSDVADIPMVVDRVAWREGCVGVIGRTSP